MLRYKPIIFLLILLLVPALSFAEFYKYRDKDGVLRFTDNLVDVPEDQRPKVDNYSEPDDFLTPHKKKKKAIQKEKASKKIRKGSGRLTKDSSFMGLNRVKTELDAEHAELLGTKQAMNREKNTLSSIEAVREYQDKVRSLNERIVDYEKRRAEFKRKIDAGQGSWKPETGN